MNFNKYHVSKNLFIQKLTGVTIDSLGVVVSDANYDTYIAEVSDGETYTVSNVTGTQVFGFFTTKPTLGTITYNSSRTIFSTSSRTLTVPTGENIKYIGVRYNTSVSDAMLNTGSQPLPYEPYSSEVWHDTPHYIHNTSTDTITTLPADIYANDTTATVGLKGNMYQASGVSPTNPIQPSECGDLEIVGEKAGQYKIPISSASTTTPVYLGEVETTRKVKKLVLTGEETYQNYPYSSTNGVNIINILETSYRRTNGLCNIYPVSTAAGSTYCLWIGSGGNDRNLYFVSILSAMGLTDASEFKSWVAQQYAAGTPVTVWYVLATEETGIVNEPIRKIGNYADTVSGITIPTIAGADSFDVQTTLKPSEVTVNYKGWHPVADVHEYDNGAWT